MDTPLAGWIDPAGMLHPPGERRDEPGTPSSNHPDHPSSTDCCTQLCMFCASMNAFKRWA